MNIDETLTESEIESYRLSLFNEYWTIMNFVIEDIKSNGAPISMRKLRNARKSIAFKLLRRITQ